MKNNKNKISVIILTFLLFVLSGTLILSFSIPDSAIVLENENAKNFLPEGYRWLFSVENSMQERVWSNDSSPLSPKYENSQNLTVYFCKVIPVKTVEVSRTKKRMVSLGGDAIGISLETDGVLVVGTTPVSEKSVSPAKKAGIMRGDIIEKVNGKGVSRTREISEAIEKTDGEITFTIRRGKKTFDIKVSPEQNENGKEKVGLWIRDTVSGIGTLTFLTDDSFGALGHPISDADTGMKVEAKGGNIYRASIVGVEKGQKGSAGSLSGIFTSDKIAQIKENTDSGVFGNINSKNERKTVSIALKEEIECGKAVLFCDVGSGVEDFEIEILRVMPSGEKTKGMVIEITDKRLIEKTGGIVQGMSGSPIVQNGKLIGAVTHVFVNEPTKGYAIFIENMLSEAEN